MFEVRKVNSTPYDKKLKEPIIYVFVHKVTSNISLYKLYNRLSGLNDTKMKLAAVGGSTLGSFVYFEGSGCACEKTPRFNINISSGT